MAIIHTFLIVISNNLILVATSRWAYAACVCICWTIVDTTLMTLQGSDKLTAMF